MPNVDLTRIASNIGAMNALMSLTQINNQLATHQMRLQTGKRINTAADDPAGLTIGTKLWARSEGLKVALANIGDAKNLLSVAESGLSRINDILVEMKNKCGQAATDTSGSAERQACITQMTAYARQIDDMINQTNWNGRILLDGSSSALQFLTGPTAADFTIMTPIDDLRTSGSLMSLADASYNLTLPASAGSGVLAPSSAGSAFSAYMSLLESKLDIVSLNLSNIGSLHGRLTFKESQVMASQINVESSYSRIMNANMAEEQVNNSKLQILQQTATAMLAQANTAPQFLLQLFR